MAQGSLQGPPVETRFPTVHLIPKKAHRTLIALFGLLLPASLFAEEQPPITEADVASFAERFQTLKERKAKLDEAIDGAEESKKVKGEGLVHLRKNLNLSYLSALMDLERDLAILATPKELITKEVDVTGLSSRDNDRIPEMRLEIMVAERERIQEGIKTKKENYGDEKFHLAQLKKETDLWELYLRAAKKFDREIEKLERAIAKERKSSIPDEDDIEELETEHALLLEEKKTLSTPVFGYSFGGGYDYPLTNSLKSAADLQLALQKEREDHLHFLRTGETNKGEGEKRGGSIGGTFIYSDNLGVVLDVSGSMSKFIEPLKEEIAATFESPHYREIGDCSLVNKHRYPSPGLHVSKRSYTMSRFGELLVVNQVDTLYWFSDLRDTQEAASLRSLLEMLIRSGADFNVRSVKQDASRLLEPIITHFEQE